MSRTSSFTGRLTKPQLNIHTTGDALIPVQSESAYGRAATTAGSTPLLRQRYVDNAGHCTFSPGEQIAALHTLEDRIRTGQWLGSDPAALNSRAIHADPSSPARYLPYVPAAYPARTTGPALPTDTGGSARPSRRRGLGLQRGAGRPAVDAGIVLQDEAGDLVGAHGALDLLVEVAVGLAVVDADLPEPELEFDDLGSLVAEA